MSRYKSYFSLMMLIFAVAAYLTFYIPLGTDSVWAKFSPTGFIHNGYRGLDFLQLPRGAHSLFNGESISGNGSKESNAYATFEWSNLNAYHPVVTILLGGFLQLFKPEMAKWIWHFLKLFSSLLVLGYIIYQYRSSKHVVFAACLYFLNIVHFQEIQILQFQSLTNLFLLIGLYCFHKHKAKIASFAFICSLLVKPFFIFGIAAIFIRSKQWRSLLWIAIILGYLTVPFLFFANVSYFFDNLFSRFQTAKVEIYTAPDVFALQSAIFYMGFSAVFLKILGCEMICLLMILAFYRYHSVATLSLMAIVIWLSFDRLVYEYHFTAVATILFFGVLTEKSWQTPTAKSLCVLITLPSIYIILKYFNVEFRDDGHMTEYWWSIAVCARQAPLWILLGYLLCIEPRLYENPSCIS